MNTTDYESSRCVGMNHDTKDMLKLFVMLNDTSSNVVINSLLRQWYLNSLASLEDTYPDQWSRWQQIRDQLHKLKI